MAAGLANDDDDQDQHQDQDQDHQHQHQDHEQGRPAEPSGNKLLAGQTVSQLDLFIDNVQAGTTTGEYMCLASNSEGSVEARSQVVLAVPAVISTMPRNQTKLEGEKVELVCQAKALPSNITYKWFFNDKPIQTLKWFESRHTIRRDGTLVIHSLHRDDQGQYKCQATNGLSHRHRPSSAASRKAAAPQEPAPIYAEASAHLSVEYPARVSYSPPLQYLPLGLPGLVRCFVQAAPPVEFFTWTLNNQQFDPNVDQNVERLANGSLLIRQVSKQYEGKYRCTPFNKHGSAGSSAAMEVRVEEPPYFELKPAEFYKATLNGHVKIPCEARGMPKPSVTWRRVVEASAEEGRPSVAANSNQLASLHLEEAGEEQDERLPAVRKQQLAGKQVEVAHELEGGNSVGASEDKQQSVIVVYAKLPLDRSEYKSSHLFLHGLRKEDHGRYECVIENEVATLVASTMLYIEG